MSGCIFCQIINKQIPAAIVYEDDQVLAFNDIAPKAPVHILVIPKQHLLGISQVEKIFPVLTKLAKEKGIDQTGYRIVVNQGQDAGQAVDHLHFHLLGGRPLHWPPG